MPDSGVFKQLVAQWQRQSTAVLAPAMTADEVTALWTTLGVRLTQDVSDLYTTVGGMQDGYPDDRAFELWCHERINEENRNSPRECVWFADWLISSHRYALKPVDDIHSAVFLDNESECLAGSLYEFAEKLLRDPTSVGVML